MLWKPACPLIVAGSLFVGVAGLVLESERSSFYGDQKLNVKTLVTGSENKKCLGGWNAINPSFAKVPGTTDMAVAFRGLCLQRTAKHASWFSQTVIGKIPASDIRSNSRTSFNWKSLKIAPDLRFHAGQKGQSQCTLPDTDKAVGAEDPRLIQTHDGLYAIVTGYSLVHNPGSTQCGKHGMLLHAAKVKSVSPPSFYPPKELVFEGMGKIEKNWAMFVAPSSTGSTVNAVYSVYPHKIASVNLASGNVKFIANSYSPGLVKLAKHMGMQPKDFHGGGGVAYVKSGGNEYFLSVAHVIVRRNGGYKEYWNFPYKFEAHYPYKILHVGKKLTLTTLRNPAYTESWVAFVTTVLYDQGDVFIGYGSGDRSSRTLRMSLGEFNRKHFPSSLVEGEEDVVERLDDDVELEDVEAFGNAGFVGEARNSTHGCRDELSPSICRFPHEAAEPEALSEDVHESNLDAAEALSLAVDGSFLDSALEDEDDEEEENEMRDEDEDGDDEDDAEEDAEDEEDDNEE